MRWGMGAPGRSTLILLSGPAGDFSMTQIFKDLSKLTSTILLALSIASCADPGAARVEKSEASSPPGYTTTRGGDAHDFDYFAGGWTTRQRRLKTRGVGSAEWEEFPATLCMSPYLGGMATVDELYFPTKGWAGLTLRTFDLEKRQWSIYWVSSAGGRGLRRQSRRLLRRGPGQWSPRESPLHVG